jgi:CheY-like chemotaxis protein
MSETPETLTTRILLVDDDPHIRTLGRELLENLGYGVETAGDGEEVLQKFHQGNPPDLVILDYNLPGMSGLEVFQRLRTSSPGTKVLMASGFFSQKEMEQLRAGGAAGLLGKPFRLRELQSRIEEALGKSSGT